jgi:outer membrane protein assembly factor BamB
MRALGRRVTSREQFACAWNLAVDGKVLVLPAGGALVWLEDVGDQAKLRGVHLPETPTLGLSIDETGAVYRQWHKLDNGGHVEILRCLDGQVKKEGIVPGTETSWSGTGLLSFCSVSVRGKEVYRTRPQEGFGLCRHSLAGQPLRPLGGYPAIASPILLRNEAVYGGLDGSLYVVPLSGKGEVWSFKTPFGKAISAPTAVCDGRIYFGCEDGFLYVLGPQGRASLPAQPVELWKIRSPLGNKQADPAYDRFTSFGDWANSNADQQGIQPPFKIKWIRRYEGSAKHFSTFGGGRMYTHTAEGQIFAVEQETGRLLWRRYFPGVHISYTSPLYYGGRLLVPQAGLERCRLRCLDAATGDLLWEAPFAGSPSWNRQQPPVVWSNLVVYMFGTGRYGPAAPDLPGEKNMPWLFEHQNNPSFPSQHHPMVRAYDIDTGKEVWNRDFSAFGSGGDEASLCLMDQTLYYSCFFGHSAEIRRGLSGPKGITAALDPCTGRIIWLTTKHSVYGGCALSGKDQRLYLGGYNPVAGTDHRYVWCLDARDGSLVWQSEPLQEAIQVVTVGSQFLFVHAQYKNGSLLDKETGRVLTRLTEGYKCTRFTLSEPYLLGSNLDVIDLSDPQNIRLVSTGPRLDPSECIGAVVSNGRVFYTGHGGGLQVGGVCGPEATGRVAPWEQP